MTQQLGNQSQDLSSWIGKNKGKVQVKKLDESFNDVNITTNVYYMPYELMGLSNCIQKPKFEESVPVTPETLSPNPAVKFTCLTCGLTFSEHSSQLNHFKTAWHVANIKRKMRGENSLSETEFTSSQSAQASQNSSINEMSAGRGDDSDEQEGVSSDDSDSSDNETANPTTNTTSTAEDIDESARKSYRDQYGIIRKEYSNIMGPQFVVEPNCIAPYRFRFSAALLRADSPLSSRDWPYASDLWTHLDTGLQHIRNKTYMAVIVLRSGRFAGAVFNNANVRTPLVVHKVIRRYTVRAKAGGGQSSHDSKHGKANSMGAQLRRYGEQMLEEDIEKLLTAWVDYLSMCSVILIDSTKTMRGVLFEKEDSSSLANGSSSSSSTSSTKRSQLLQKSDPRIVFVPFAVDKPTLDTAKLIRERVLSVNISTAAEKTNGQDDEKEEEEKNVLPQVSTAGHASNTVASSIHHSEMIQGTKVNRTNQQLTTATVDKPDETAKLGGNRNGEEDVVEEEEDALVMKRTLAQARRILDACEHGTDETAVMCIKEVAQFCGVDVQQVMQQQQQKQQSVTVARVNKGDGSDNEDDNNSDSEDENEKEKTSTRVVHDANDTNNHMETAKSKEEKEKEGGGGRRSGEAREAGEESLQNNREETSALHPLLDLDDILRMPNNLDDLSSPLHLSAHRHLTRTVRILLLLGANPEQLDARGRTPYFLATTKEMRDVFRRARGDLGESRWSWTRAGVPEAITDDRLAEQKRKEKEKKKRAQARKKENKAKAEQVSKDAALALQMQADFQRQEQLERAQRERQLAGQCAICQKSLFGQNFFDVLDQRCCSTGCVQQLRRKLAADAAAARLGMK